MVALLLPKDVRFGVQKRLLFIKIIKNAVKKKNREGMKSRALEEASIVKRTIARQPAVKTSPRIRSKSDSPRATRPKREFEFSKFALPRQCVTANKRVAAIGGARTHSRSDRISFVTSFTVSNDTHCFLSFGRLLLMPNGHLAPTLYYSLPFSTSHLTFLVSSYLASNLNNDGWIRFVRIKEKGSWILIARYLQTGTNIKST